MTAVLESGQRGEKRRQFDRRLDRLLVVSKISRSNVQRSVIDFRQNDLVRPRLIPPRILQQTQTVAQLDDFHIGLVVNLAPSILMNRTHFR